MATVTRTTRVPAVFGALLVAGVLVGGAYTLANPSWLPHANLANAASTEEVLAAYTKKDSDGDGLPDWEEALYGTNPNNAHSVSQTLTDSEAVSQGLVQPRFSSGTASSTDSFDPSEVPGVVAADGTVTAEFSRTFFTDYLSQTKGQTPTQDQITAYVAAAIQDFVSKHASKDVYTAAQVHVLGTGSALLEKYASAAEQAITKNSIVSDKNEIDYLADVVEKNDLSALPHIAEKGKAYTGIATSLMQVPVPSEASVAHVKMANAFARVGEDITDLSTYNTDPLRAYIGLSQYQADVKSLSDSFTAMASVFTADAVTVSPDTSGFNFYDMIQAPKTQ